MKDNDLELEFELIIDPGKFFSVIQNTYEDKSYLQEEYQEVLGFLTELYRMPCYWVVVNGEITHDLGLGQLSTEDVGMIGFGGYSKFFLPSNDADFKCHEFLFGPTFVRKAYRGQGIQLKLIQERIKYIKANFGHSYLYSTTSVDNIASSNNLIRAGFTLTKPWDVYYNNVGTSLFWKKEVVVEQETKC